MPLPQPSDSFAWTQEPWGPALRCLPLLPHAPHLFTSRAVSVSRNPDDPAVAAVAASLGLTSAGVVQVHQVHGCRVLAVRAGAGPPPGFEGDVLLSDDPQRAVGVRVADCAPLLIADRSRGAVAAVHAGWRGTAARAAVAAVIALRRVFGSDPADLVAAIGPLIRVCCYEVGPATRDAFNGKDADRWFSPGRGGRLQLDVAAANRDQLEAAGVSAAQIHDSGLCTACHLDAFHSYRKEGPGAGRLMGLIRPRAPLHPSRG